MVGERVKQAMNRLFKRGPLSMVSSSGPKAGDSQRNITRAPFGSFPQRVLWPDYKIKVKESPWPTNPFLKFVTLGSPGDRYRGTPQKPSPQTGDTLTASQRKYGVASNALSGLTGRY